MFCYLSTVALIFAYISINNNLKLKPSNGLHPLLQIRWHFTTSQSKISYSLWGHVYTSIRDYYCDYPPSKNNRCTPTRNDCSIRVDRSIPLWSMNVLSILCKSSLFTQLELSLLPPPHLPFCFNFRRLLTYCEYPK